MMVSVITPTWQRPFGLVRAMYSVAGQTHRDHEHIVVADGVDNEAYKVCRMAGVRYLELPEHIEPHDHGCRARNAGIREARGEIIAFLDDDNTWRERHLEVLMLALVASGADFAYSQGLFHMGDYEMIVGVEPPRHAQIDTSLIAAHRALFDVANWPAGSSTESVDWELVQRWMRAGASHVFVPEVTMDYYARAAAPTS